MKKILGILGALTITSTPVGFLANSSLIYNKTNNINDNLINSINNEVKVGNQQFESIQKDFSNFKNNEENDTKLDFFNSLELKKEEFENIAKTAQNWDVQAIDAVLKEALQYHNQNLIIDKNKLDTSKLPTEVLENLNSALLNLNNAVSSGFIKVSVTSNNQVELIYSTNTSSTFDSDSDEIIYFENQSSSNIYSSYMWYTTYGPSKWWKFWEWGGYMHFSEQAVQNAKWALLVSSAVSLPFIFRNAKRASTAINELKLAWNAGNTAKITSSVKELTKFLGSNALTSLGGDIGRLLEIYVPLLTFIVTLLFTPGLCSIVLAFIEMIASIIASVASHMLNVDRGNGVKWQWVCFVAPGNMYAK